MVDRYIFSRFNIIFKVKLWRLYWILLALRFWGGGQFYWMIAQIIDDTHKQNLTTVTLLQKDQQLHYLNIYDWDLVHEY